MSARAGDGPGLLEDPFARLAGVVVKVRWPVVVAWLVLVGAAAVLLAPKAADALQGGGFVVAGSQSDSADALLRSAFDASSQDTAVAVFRSTTGSARDPAFRQAVAGAADRLRAVPGVHSVTDPYTTPQAGLVSSDGHTALLLVSIAGDEAAVESTVPRLRQALAGTALEHYVTGSPAANYDSLGASEDDAHRAELIFMPVLFVLLLLVFRTLPSALIPLSLGGMAVLMIQGLLYLVASAVPTSIFALNTGSMIGLALCIDYSLIVVTRYREEILDGQAPLDALRITMATAGRSITYSAITVILAMGLMTVYFLPMVMVRSISGAVALVAVVALLQALTLLPAVLSLLGPRIERLAVLPRRRRPPPGRLGFWYRFSELIMGRPWAWLALGVAVLGVLGSPLGRLNIGGPVVPPGVEADRGQAIVAAAFSAGYLAPIQVVADSSRQLDSTYLATLRDRIAQDAEVEAVLPPRSNAAGTTATITVLPRHDAFDTRTENLLARVRDSYLPDGAPAGVRLLVGGETATFRDYQTALYGGFPLLALLVMGLIFVILAMFFQSLALPLKAVILNLASILATFGVLVLIFQFGWGAAAFGFTPLGRLTVISPAIVYVVLFALSTDYEVFLLARVKEYYRVTGNNREAVAAGLQHTAGVITAAALVLVGTFGSFGFGKTIEIKEIGLGLAVGVLIDATVVRVVLVPATMRLMGAANWWMPAWLKRVLPELREGAAFELAHEVAPVVESAVAAPAPAPAPTPAGPPAPAPTEGAWIQVVGDWAGPRVMRLAPGRPFRFGRDVTNEARLVDIRVSRLHARIDQADGTYLLTDLSSNGVLVNGRRVEPRPATTPLKDGDFFEIRGYDPARFVFRRARPVAAPVPAAAGPGR